MINIFEHRHFLTSLTRATDLDEENRTYPIDKSAWNDGDFVVCQVTDPGKLMIELVNGRMAPVMEGDLVVGAFGVRHATLEATGSWKAIDESGQVTMLTGAGLMGKLTSTSPFIPDLISTSYLGHLHRDGKKLSMLDTLPAVGKSSYQVPTILFIGTSMNSGKTSTARVVTRLLKEQGRKVVGAKLTGAGRYRDILAMQDAGADVIFDFVDVGLPSTVIDREVFTPRLNVLLSMIQQSDCDVAVVEIGASPFEPYNGQPAIEAIQASVKCTVLCALEPYSVYGVMKGFDLRPDIVAGPATNTIGGTDLIEKLCAVQSLNIIDPQNKPALDALLEKALD